MAAALVLSLLSFAGILFLFYWNFSRRTVRKRTEFLLKEVRDQFNEMLSDCDQATERNIFVFKSSLQELKEAISVAEKRIALLDDKIRQDNRAAQTYADLRDSEKVLGSCRRTTENRLPLRPSTGEVRPKRKLSEKEERKRQIIEAYSMGRSMVQIASDFSVSIGEVEMMIGIKKSSRNA